MQKIKNGYVAVAFLLIIFLTIAIGWQNYLLILKFDQLNENLRNTNYYIVQILNQQKPESKTDQDLWSKGYLMILYGHDGSRTAFFWQTIFFGDVHRQGSEICRSQRWSKVVIMFYPNNQSPSTGFFYKTKAWLPRPRPSLTKKYGFHAYRRSQALPPDLLTAARGWYKSFF